MIFYPKAQEVGYVERYAGYQSFEVGMMARKWGEPELYKSSGLKSLRF